MFLKVVIQWKITMFGFMILIIIFMNEMNEKIKYDKNDN